MIYDRIENIPMKLFLEIEATGELKLLSDKKFVDNEDLKLAWLQLEEQSKHFIKAEKSDKILKLSSKVEELSAKNEKVALAVHVLENLHFDEDAIKLLEDEGYHFKYKTIRNRSKRAVRKQYLKDVETIKRQSIAIEIRLNQFRERLPEPEDEKKTKNDSFDKTLMMYCAFVGIGYINPNKITFTEYYGIIESGNEKMKSIERSTVKNKVKRNGKR